MDMETFLTQFYSFISEWYSTRKRTLVMGVVGGTSSRFFVGDHLSAAVSPQGVVTG